MGEGQKAFKVEKPFRTADYHFDLLKSRKLSIPDTDEIRVKGVLRKLGYFRLSGYFPPLQREKDIFNEGTTFDDILRLYEFDKRLRVMTSFAIKSVEIELKARLTDVYSAVYESDWYKNRDLFMTDAKGWVHVMEFDPESGSGTWVEREVALYDLLIGDIDKCIRRNGDKPFIKKFQAKYGSGAISPSWMMMECTSFGPISRLYALLLNSSEKKAVARHFGVIMPDMFSSWLHAFVIIRNACAHHARIWNAYLDKEISFPNKLSSMIVSNREDNHVKKFYGVSSCLLRCLESINPDLCESYKARFNRLCVIFSIDKTAMGFPKELNQYDVWNR